MRLNACTASCNLKTQRDTRGAEQPCLQGLFSLRNLQQTKNPYQSRWGSPNQAQRSKRAQPSSPSLKRNCTEDRGNILVQGLWARGTDCIIHVHITDIDAKSQQSKDPHKVLEAYKREMKKKYLQTCLKQRWHVSPFVQCTGGLLGKESQTFLKKLSALLAEKCEKGYSEICGFVNAEMSIAIVQATHLCLQGSQSQLAKLATASLSGWTRLAWGFFRGKIPLTSYFSSLILAAQHLCLHLILQSYHSLLTRAKHQKLSCTFESCQLYSH
jgi:hypothetical protein